MVLASISRRVRRTAVLAVKRVRMVNRVMHRPLQKAVPIVVARKDAMIAMVWPPTAVNRQKSVSVLREKRGSVGVVPPKTVGKVAAGMVHRNAMHQANSGDSARVV